ncbi:Glycosyltransferase [Labilithrix luteola]|uniref:Glycosyltransferase n=1 Tax=Labilithrix luteola TaxID=1391654 RepID=A0A0K1Q7M7_9BACT|nr:glycosyltransferase family 4 protein [Labilithrix luteola]AKV01821.1 Glycosyltransferase [Labilithrix luteola]
MNERASAEPAPVLHVVVAGEVGGAERMLVDLASGDTARRHTIALMTPSARLRALFHDAGLVVDDRGPVRENPASYLVRSLGPFDVRWLAQTIRARRAGIVHLHTFGSQVVGTRAAIRTGARIVRTEHSTRVYDDPSCWIFSRWSLRRADASVCISEHVRDVALLRAPWAERTFRVIPNGIDVERFTPAAHAARGESERVRFVMVGRLEPRKGIDIALHALNEVPRAELEIVGEGESRAELERLGAQLGVSSRVRFVGYQADVREAIARADVALSSARAEGLGIALLEAMAQARAVVALPTGGIPEFVKDGETGWLATGSSSHALAAIMRSAIEHPDERSRRGRRARELVLTRYSLASMRASYEALYDWLRARPVAPS